MRAQHEIAKMINKYQALQDNTTDAKLREMNEAVISAMKWAKDKEVKEVVTWIAKLEVRRNPEAGEYLSDRREKQLRVLYWIADTGGLEGKIEQLRKGADTVVTYSAIVAANATELSKSVARSTEDLYTNIKNRVVRAKV